MDTPGDGKQVQLKVYELYLARIMKEGDWFWLRFSLFLSLNLGGVAALGFLIKDHLATFPQIPLGLLIIIAVFSVGAFGLAKTWEAIVVDGGAWQAFFSARLAALESELNEGGIDAYSLIHGARNTPVASSIVDNCIRVAVFFRWFYVALALLSIALTYWSK